MNYRTIHSTLDEDQIVIHTEFGYDLYFKVRPITEIDAITEYEDGKPDFQVNLRLMFVKAVETNKAIPREKIEKSLRERSIVPLDLDYDDFLIGFVFATDDDPNNHKWWLDFRKGEQTVHTIFIDELDIKCPITTKSWFGEEIYHGRMVVSKDNLLALKQPSLNKIEIIGKPVPGKTKAVCKRNVIPKDTEYLRLRYNIKEDFWICDFMNNGDERIESIPSKGIICDAPLYGQVTVIEDMYKVSTKVYVKDITDMATAVNTLIIRG